MTVCTGACYFDKASALICTGTDGILNTLFFHLGLVKGLNEVLKALDRKQALICVLAADCEDAKYKKFVTVSTNRPIV
jgi:hypothetical protein